MDMGGGEERESGVDGESSMEAYTLPCAKQIANGNLLYDTGNSNWGSMTTKRGGEVQEAGGRLKTEGTLVYLLLTHCILTHIYIESRMMISMNIIDIIH